MYKLIVKARLEEQLYNSSQTHSQSEELDAFRKIFHCRGGKKKKKKISSKQNINKFKPKKKRCFGSSTLLLPFKVSFSW